VQPTYPLFVFEKDDRSIRTVESAGHVLHWHEAIDIENGEYEFWDATGSGVSVTIVKRRVKSIDLRAEAFPLRDAFISYADSLKLQGVDFEGSPIEVWERIQMAIKSAPKKRGWLSKLF
jgi:hypothetical protein